MLSGEYMTEFVFMVFVVVVLAVTNSISFIYSLELRGSKKEAERQRDAAIGIADKALEAQQGSETRQAEIAKLHQELLGRPITYVMPAGAIENLGNAIVQYLQSTERK